jgi:hypothetical protein
MNLDRRARVTLLDLVTEETVEADIDWQLDHPGTSGSKFNGLRMLHAASQ